jgi:SAM-dependent methyltransferase
MPNRFSPTINVYNKFASKFVSHFERKLDTAELDEFLKDIPQGGYILDAGCGSARDSAYIVSQGYKALGIDLSEGLLAEAKKLHPEVTTQLMSLTNIDLDDETFEGIWCKAALLHLEREDVSKVLNDYKRILKQNGKLFIQTKEGEGSGEQPVPFDDTLTRLFTFFTEEELVQLVEKAGFTVTKSHTFNGLKRSALSRDQDWLIIFAKKE